MRPTSVTRWSAWKQIYRCLIFPRQDRFPKLWSHWLPLTLTVVVLVAGVWAGPWLYPRISCRAGLLPTESVWSQDSECVGASDGSYAFGLSDFDPIFQKIAKQNEEAKKNPCGTGDAPVTVGVLVTLTSPNNGGRDRHELEGFAAGQASANMPGCIRPVRLRVAQIGKTEQAAERVAQLLADNPDVVAVVGMGQSDQGSAQAVQVLAMHRIPMVDDIITAEGFDQNGSRSDNPDFSRCADADIFDRGIGQGFFYRVAYRVATQARQLGQYLKHADFIITPTTATDPFTCTALPLIHRQFGDAVHEVRFDPTDPTTVPLAVQQLCGKAQDVTAVYAARAGDLSRFLTELDGQYQNGVCQARSITVASISDASRIRAPEPEPTRESLRIQALKSLGDGKVRLVYTALANPEVLVKEGSPGFANLQKRFTEIGFDQTDLDDGWAINAYDALSTVTAAVDVVPTNHAITPSDVNTAIGLFSSAGHPVPAAAQGPLVFDNNGNRTDRNPVVEQICSPSANRKPPHSPTVEVYPSPGSCP
ncbi:MAG: ABC transporter substrate-binding protein [Pseudonocardiaceae bacterium]